MEVALRRRSLLLLPVLAIAFGCGRIAGRRASVPPEITLADHPRRPGFPAVLVLAPNSPQTLEVWRSLRLELSDDFDVVTEVVGVEAGSDFVASALKRVAPRCVVLMDNPTVSLYARFQREHPRDRYPPAIVVMSSFLEQQQLLRNMTGIAYEIPGVTVFVHLRSFMQRPLRRVGVVHRAAFEQYVSRQRKLAAMEKIELMGAQVDNDAGARQVRQALRNLVVDRGADAVWVLNDNRLLTPRIISAAWLPVLRGVDLPVVVGVEALVSREVPFGTLAMVPDLEALGMQTANLIFDLQHAQWRVDEFQVQLPLSVQTTVDAAQARERLGLADGALEKIDHVVE